MAFAKADQLLANEQFFAFRFILETNRQVMHSQVLLRHHRVLLVCNGSAHFHIGDSIFYCEKGDIIFGYKDEYFYAKTSPDCEYIYIDFDGKRAHELFDLKNITTLNRIISGYEDYIFFWKCAFSRISHINVDMTAKSAIVYTFADFVPKLKPNDKVFYKMHRIIDHRFNDPELSLHDVAIELSYNQRYLSYYFHKEFGVRFVQYMNMTRVNFAMTLFEHGIMSVKTAAFLSGYDDQYYFSVLFKENTGMPPEEYVFKVHNIIKK